MKKNYFIAWLFASMMCVGLSSCGDDPDITETPGSETDPGTDEDEGSGTGTDPGNQEPHHLFGRKAEQGT